MTSSSGRAPKTALRKSLGLFDVYVICTGAIISSGFFLLPGIAFAKTGPSVVLAYLLSGLLVLPALFSQAELATAMPRAGGAYFFLDRTLGPMVGTIGGFGTWIALVLKASFALVGLGAYATLLAPRISGPWVAVGLGLAFIGLNLFGAKQTTRVLRVLVTALLAILALFLADGLSHIAAHDPAAVVQEKFAPFLGRGVDGLLGTVGLVFVSYVGLTKVASVAEEVQQPDRTIPRGMLLSLCTVVVIYVLGTFIMVSVLDPRVLRASHTPVADAAAHLSLIPPRIGVGLVTVAAVAAFASMANAGLMAASRYPLAMARDGLLPDRLAGVGRFGTPVPAVLLTGAVLVLILTLLDVEGIAKVASALQLMLFALVNVAVIVMRESRIPSYDPGFRSPFYPWIQIAGVVLPFFLVGEMGWLAGVFAFGTIGFGAVWYRTYAARRLERTGAIYHVFERLGRRRFDGLDTELREILSEKGLREEDPYDEVVARALTITVGPTAVYADIVQNVAGFLAERTGLPRETLIAGFEAGAPGGRTPGADGVALPHCRLADAVHPEMVLVRSHEGIASPADGEPGARERFHALVFLVSPEGNPNQHLRILAQFAGHVAHDRFMERWLAARRPQDLRETLLRDDRFLSIDLASHGRTRALVGRQVRELAIPKTSLLAVIRRGREVFAPRGKVVLEKGDRITFIGEPGDIETLYRRYAAPDDEDRDEGPEADGLVRPADPASG